MTVYSGIFDSHAHYDDPKFDEDREEVISSLPSRGICGVINCGTNADTSRACLALAEKYDFFYAAAGIHPEDITDDSAALLPQIAAMLSKPKTAALGEIGLDYHWTKDNKQAQIDIFASQLALAVQLDKPVIIHDREAHEDVLELVKKYRPRGVLHSFSGSAELADEYIKLGMYIGIGGAVTFRNARKLPEVIARHPLRPLPAGDRLSIQHAGALQGAKERFHIYTADRRACGSNKKH